MQFCSSFEISLKQGHAMLGRLKDRTTQYYCILLHAFISSPKVPHVPP
jgi:hypothetical protein